MPRWLKNNALSIVTLAAFGIFAALQALTGWQVRNDDLAAAGLAADSFWHYLGTGHFTEALFENWESEFLQMGAYVLLTALLVQRGSPESKPLDQGDRAEDDPANAGAQSPAWSRTHGIQQWLYRNSLSLGLFGFFLLSFTGHLIGGTAEFNEQQALEQGADQVSVWQFLGTADFWFQSMQNWQSEFLAVAALVLLSIVLRQHGSPQSKPVTAPHAQTGTE
ncbi:DUF6766 family protein [Catelliglobosispora koreensis]|uniref:DUF6766 family protein n=1 Tax=Catelliglobosispora koreensis TaxID=129052 RepID=UPI000376AC89|nr:DUF6766 family protein [Catelliglobosispora koreensis]